MARYKRTPKTIYISDDDDCFDADYDTQEEEQKEQREEENQGDKEQGKDKFPVEMLKPGTLIIIRDEHSRKGSQAFIINPGVSNNGKTVSIQWVVDSRKKNLPVENIDEVVTSNSRSKRNRSKTKFLSSSDSNDEAPTKPKKKARSSSMVRGKSGGAKKSQSKASSKKAKSRPLPICKPPPLITSPKLTQHLGEQISILSHESEKKQYFLKVLFGNKLKIIENPLDGTKVRLDKSIVIDGLTYHLLFSKEKEVSQQSSKFEKMTNKRYVAYYVGGEEFATADDLKADLEKLGDFSSLALEPGKICSRLELMVSPACSQRNGIFEMHVNDFECIKENGHVGCGFAPVEFFAQYFTERVFAVQVRIFSPSLGWFKGMLMRKPSIKKIQLPSSMLKVPKTKVLDCFDVVYLLVNNTFPNAASKGIDNDLKQANVSKSVLKNTKKLGDMFINILFSQGLHMDDIDEYENSFYRDGQLCRLRHDSNACVGVADPTSELSVDTVYVGGLRSLHCTDQVFITRYPCTERKDGKLLKLCVGFRPNGMSDENWNFLQSLPFGILVFGPSSDPHLSLPEQISDGDLDGDLYHILWDLNIVNMLKDIQKGSVVEPFSTSAPESYYGPASHENDDSVTTHSSSPNSTVEKSKSGYFECRRKVGDKYEVITGIEAVDDNTLKVQIDGETQIVQKSVKQDMYEYEILDHKGTDLKMRYKLNGTNDDRWVNMSECKKQIPEALADYALKKNLLNQSGWKWTRNHLRETVMKCVVSHQGDGSNMIFMVRYDDASEDEVGFKTMKEEVPDILYKYASKKNILPEWRMEYIESSKENWFEVAQDYNAQLKLLRDQSRLKCKLFEAYKKKVREGDMEAADAFSQAFKKALDLRKHACSIKLPNHYFDKNIPKDLQIYVMND